MEKLTTYEKVIKLLRENPATRDDDFYLYAYYCIAYCDGAGLELLSVALLDHELYDLPSFASIIRYRRLAQKEFEELQPSGGVQGRRRKAEQDYRKKAREHNAS